jgi:hypothetical protein
MTERILCRIYSPFPIFAGSTRAILNYCALLFLKSLDTDRLVVRAFSPDRPADIEHLIEPPPFSDRRRLPTRGRPFC